MRAQLPALNILCTCYEVVKSLREYLSDVLQDTAATGEARSQAFAPREDDSQSYRHLLESTYVAVRQSPNRRFVYEEPVVHMGGAIKRAQEILLRMKEQKQNILKAGYCLNKTSNEVVSFAVNTMVTALLGPDWEKLLESVGIAVMLHLLVDTSLFISLPNGCLCQLTGEPLHVTWKEINYSNQAESKKAMKPIKRPAPDTTTSIDEPSPKRQKLERTGTNRSAPKPSFVRKPSTVLIMRAKMFYARPYHIFKTTKILMGFPLNHIFNRDNRDGRLYHSRDRNVKAIETFYEDPDGKETAEHARQLLKYIFPRQHGLDNPFRVCSSYEAYRLKDYTDREDEINRLRLRKRINTPKRLKDIVPLADKMFWRHKKCPYKLILDKFCPSKIKSESDAILDETTILEWMSEQSIQLKTQLSANQTTVLSENINLPGNSAAKPRFGDFVCPYAEVFRFVVTVTKAVIPKRLWGSKKNFKLIMHRVKDFITARRYETFNLHTILQGFSATDCDWLIPPGPGAKQQYRVSVSDALKRRELLEEFLFWFFDSFLTPLIKTCFYVTESSAFRNRVLYFRQDDWVTLCAPLIGKLKGSTFEKLSETQAKEILRQRRLGFAFVRLLPKESGVRPIINLRKKSSDSGSSINQMLEAAFHILTYEKKTRPELIGASVWGASGIYTKLKDFKSRLKRDNLGRLPKLYFVKVDVQACFDTIDQGKLLSIIKNLISEDSFTIRKYVKFSSSADKNHISYARRAYPSDDDPQFLDMAIELANVLRNIIFVDATSPSTTSKTKVLELLDAHITDNIVKIGSNYYRQVIGIPQGSVVSTLLCNFFYGDLEKQFKPYTGVEDSTLLRMVDDYLLVTTSFLKAKSFLDMMNKGHPEYGCFISKEKTMTNFDYDHQIMNAVDPRTRHFPWCGYAIDMKDLSISVDYTRYHNIDLSNTLTVSRGRKPGSAFVSKMLLLAKSRSHIIFTDSELNSRRVIYLNIYQNFLLCAMKMHCYLRDWKIECHRRSPFIRATVQKMINHCFSTLRAQSRREAIRLNKREQPFHRDSVFWLGYHAFCTILSRKPSRYKTLLRWLKRELLNPRYRKYEKRFRAVIKEGLTAMSNIIH